MGRLLHGCACGKKDPVSSLTEHQSVAEAGGRGGWSPVCGLAGREELPLFSGSCRCPEKPPLAGQPQEALGSLVWPNWGLPAFGASLLAVGHGAGLPPPPPLQQLHRGSPFRPPTALCVSGERVQAEGAKVGGVAVQQVPIDLLGVGSIRLRKAHGGHTCPERGGREARLGGGFQVRHRQKEAELRRARMGAEREGGRCPPTYLSLPAPQDWRSHLCRERQRCQRMPGRRRRGSLEKGADAHLPPKHPLPKFPTQSTPSRRDRKRTHTHTPVRSCFSRLTGAEDPFMEIN